MTESPKSALGYVRVSTEKQKEDGSHVNQREKLKEWATENDCGLDIEEDIAISGRSDDRTGYQQVMKKYPQYDVVVVRELSRFGRSPEKTVSDILEISEAGVDFVSLSETFDTTTANGRLFLRILSDFNGWFAEQRREQALEEVERRREEGEPIGRPKKLSAEEREQVRQWRREGKSLGQIKALVDYDYGVEISKTTIQRYCDGVERGEAA